MPKHARAPYFSVLGAADMPARKAELTAYMDAILALADRPAPALKLAHARAFRRAVDSFFEADLLPRAAARGDLGTCQRG